MIKKNKIQTLNIQNNLICPILDKGMRGVRYERFDKIMAILETSVVIKLMQNEAFTYSNISKDTIPFERARLDLSNFVDNDDYNYDPEEMPIYLYRFLSGKINSNLFEQLTNEGFLSMEIKNKDIKTKK